MPPRGADSRLDHGASGASSSGRKTGAARSAPGAMAGRSACEQADDAFHLGVAQVARNPVLTGLMKFLSGARRRAAWQREWDRVYRRLGVAEFQTEHSAQHARIVDAIAAGDGAAAAETMRAHLELIQSVMTVPPPTG